MTYEKLFFETFKDSIHKNTVWKMIYALHNAEGRFHHDLNHLDDLSKWAQRLRSKFLPREFVQFVLFIGTHDIIYIPGNSENEKLSSQLVPVIGELLGLDQETIANTQEWVEATADHLPTLADPNTPETLRLVLQADMAILGAPVSDYEEYAENIWKENVLKILQSNSEMNVLFINGRMKFLDSLQIEKIFIDPVFLDLRKPAKENIAAEQKRLKEQLKTLES